MGKLLSLKGPRRGRYKGNPVRASPVGKGSCTGAMVMSREVHGLESLHDIEELGQAAGGGYEHSDHYLSSSIPHPLTE